MIGPRQSLEPEEPKNKQKQKEVTMKKNNIPDLRFPQFNEPWTVKKLGKVCESSQLGGNYENDLTPNDYPLIKMGNMARGFIDLSKLEYVSNGTPSSNDKLFYGDFLFNTRNTLDLVGKVCIWREELNNAYFNSNIMRIKFSDSNSFFMNYCFNTQRYLSLLKSIATGTTSVAAIYNKDLFSLPISLPSLPEQQKIADFLSGVDEKIGQLERRLALEEQYKKGMMQRLFDQEIRFKDENGNEFPDWEEKKLGEVCERIKDGTHGSHKEVSKGKYLLSAKDIKNGRVICSSDSRIISEEDFNSIHKNYKIENGDVLLTLVGTIGQSAIVQNYNENYTFQRSVGILKVNKTIFNKYLFQLISSSSFQSKLVSHSNSSAQAGVYLKTLSSLPISLPTLPEQQKMADFLSSLDDKIGQTKAELDKARDWKRGLMQRMFV